MIDLSIIIVTYNSENQVGQLLDSIKKEQKSISLEVVVVDNNSSDKSPSIVSNHRVVSSFIQMKSNLGFSIAVNQGIKKTNGNYILLLNPDTIVLRGALERLLDFAKDTSPLGAVAPRLLNLNREPQASVFKFPTISNAIRHYFGNCRECFGKYLPSNKIQKVDVAVMAAFLIPKSTIEEIGGLNEKFFLYYEDIEFCRRLQSAKLPVYYLPAAKIKHIHGASGHFKTHLHSPLLTSARLYHGVLYSNILNLVLYFGQKWQVILKRRQLHD